MRPSLRMLGLVGALTLGAAASAAAQASGRLRVSAKVVRPEAGPEVAAEVRRAAADSTRVARVRVGVAQVTAEPKRAHRPRVVVVSFLRN